MLALLVFVYWLRPAFAQAEPAIRMPELLEPLRLEYPVNASGDARVVLHVTLDATGAVTTVDVAQVGAEDIASSFGRRHVVNSTAGYNLGAGYHFSSGLLVYSAAGASAR